MLDMPYQQVIWSYIQKITSAKVKLPIINLLRNYASDLEKYKPMQVFLYRNIEIRRTTIFSSNFIL